MPNVAITIFILNPLALPLVRCIRQLQPPQKHKETLQQALLVDALFCQQKRESSMFPLTMLCSELLGNFSDVSSSATRLSLSAIGKRIYVKWMNGSEKNGVSNGLLSFDPRSRLWAVELLGKALQERQGDVM